MKNIDFKSLAIGALLTTTIFLGIAATSNPSSQTLKLEGPIDLRLSFGPSKAATPSNTSTPTEIIHSGVGGFDINLKHSGKIGR